jgi:hypothetical protein
MPASVELQGFQKPFEPPAAKPPDEAVWQAWVAKCRALSVGRMQARICAIAILCGVLSTSALYSGDFSHYRGFQFGMNTADAAKDAGTPAAEVTLVHRRPALIQEMEWRPGQSLRSDPKNTDPVRQGLLCFVNGELYRIIVTYDPDKIEGMTADDIVEGISATYGLASRPNAEIAFHSDYAEVAKVLARWEDSEYSYDLVRTGDQSSFAMVLYSKRLDVMAQKAIVAAVRLDVQEAPQREMEKQKDQAEAERTIRDRARSVNKPNFRL